MASKDVRDQKPARDGKPAKKSGEIRDGDLDKVTGGRDAASGQATGKRQHLPIIL